MCVVPWWNLLSALSFSLSFPLFPSLPPSLLQKDKTAVSKPCPSQSCTYLPYNCDVPITKCTYNRAATVLHLFRPARVPLFFTIESELRGNQRSTCRSPLSKKIQFPTPRRPTLQLCLMWRLRCFNRRWSSMAATQQIWPMFATIVLDRRL